MPRYEVRTYKVAPLNVRDIEADSSGAALQQFAAEVKRLMAAGPVTGRNEVERVLVELFDEDGRKIGSVSVHRNGPPQPT